MDSPAAAQHKGQNACIVVYVSRVANLLYKDVQGARIGYVVANGDVIQLQVA